MALKLFGVEPVAAWSWWWILSPFVAALAWWGISDITGLTQRQAIKRDADLKEQRRKRNIKAMGLEAHDRPKNRT